MNDFNPLTDELPGEAERVLVDDSAADCPAPGVYEGVALDAYLRWDACSASRLGDLHERTAAYCRHRATTPEEPNEPGSAAHLGEVTHSAVLEPDAFERRYAVVGTCEAVKKDGAPCSNQGSVLRGGRSWCGVKGHAPDEPDDPRRVLPATTHALALAMRDATARHTTAADLIEGSVREVSIVWTDPATGLRCKARPDFLNHDLRVVGDVKTCENPNPDAFAAALCWRGTNGIAGAYRQAALQRMACRAHGLEFDHVFVAIANTAPHEVGVLRLRPTSIVAALHEVERLMDRYARCRADDAWPGLADDVVEFNLPEFHLRRLLPNDGAGLEA